MNASDAWLKIINELTNNSREFKTFTQVKSNPKYFKAFSKYGELFIDGSSLNKPSCKITMTRPITKKEFENVFALYDDYINGIPYVRRKMNTLNSSYIITLIHEIL